MPCDRSRSRAIFDSYALPLARRRGGSAAALSVMVHGAAAILVMWRGAVCLESRGGDQAEPLPASRARIAVPTVASPRVERVNLDSPPRAMATTAPIRLPASLPDPLPGPVDIDEAVSGGPGKGPSCGGGGEVGPSYGADVAPGSGDSVRDVFGSTPVVVSAAPAEAPFGDKRTHDVQFWIRADGRPMDYVYNCVVYP